MTTPKQPPEYSEALLLRLISETKDRDDLVSLNTLFIFLEEEGDITITSKIVYSVKTREYYFTFKNFLNRKN
jgi:hypothetical protein